MPRRIRRIHRCQNGECRGRVERVVAIELGGSAPARVLVGLCPRCAREVTARAELARAALDTLATLVEQTASVRQRNRALEELLVEAEGALAFQGELRRHAERDRAVLLRAHLELLRASGSGVSDERDVLLDLGLPA